MTIDNRCVMSTLTEIISLDRMMNRSNINHKHVAYIQKKNKIIAVATNFPGTYSRGCGYSRQSIHAERAVIKKLGDVKKLDGAIMIVVRIKNINESYKLVKSNPCKECCPHLIKCMNKYGLKCVYYS